MAGGMYLEVSAFGEEIINRQLMRFEANLIDLAPVFEVVGETLREASRAQFDSEGGYASGGWAKLATSTVAEKQRKGLDPHILRATGRLMESLTSKYGADHYERLSGDSLTFGSTVSYGAFHQTGTRKMPKRPPIALNEATKVAIMKQMQAAIIAGVRA